MSDLVERYGVLKKQFDEAKLSKARSQANLESAKSRHELLLKELVSKFGFNNVEELRVHIETLKTRIEESLQQIETAVVNV